MSHLPLVSVVIPAFNMSRYIARTIASVLEQSYKEIELIIVDDGSTDDTGLIVRNITAKNIIYIFQDNKGLPAARNAGIKASKGDFIAFLDADDYWHPKKIEKQAAVFTNFPEVDAVYCNFFRVDVDDHRLPDEWNPSRLGKSLFEELLFHNIITGSASSVMVRAKALQDVGLFDEDLCYAEDLDMWRRLAYRHKFFQINEYLVYIRINPSGIQSDIKKVEKGLLEYLEKVLSKIPPEYIHLRTKIIGVTYFEIIRINLKQRNYGKAFRYYWKCSSLGLSSFYYINWAFWKFQPGKHAFQRFIASLTKKFIKRN